MKNITIKSLRDKQKDTVEDTNDFFKKPKTQTSELEDLPYKPRKTKFVLKTVFSIIFIFVIGGVGGIIIDRFALPYFLVKYPELNQYEFLRRVTEGTTIIEVTKEVKISEDEAVIEAIKKVSPSVVEIIEFSSKINDSSYTYKGAGIILTSDGYIITSIANITPEEKDSDEENNIIKIKVKNGKTYETELVEIDLSTGLAIVKIQENNLPVIALNNSENLALGEKVIIIDSAVITDIVSKFINDYAVDTAKTDKPILQKRIKIINSLKSSFNGSPVINTKGEIIGISQSGNLFIPTNEVRDFIDSAMNKDL